MKQIVKIVAIRGNSGNSGMDGGGDRVLNFNHQQMGRGKTAGDFREWVPWVPRGIPTQNWYKPKFFLFLTTPNKFYKSFLPVWYIYCFLIKKQSVLLKNTKILLFNLEWIVESVDLYGYTRIMVL